MNPSVRQEQQPVAQAEASMPAPKKDQVHIIKFKGGFLIQAIPALGSVDEFVTGTWDDTAKGIKDFFEQQTKDKKRHVG